MISHGADSLRIGIISNGRCSSVGAFSFDIVSYFFFDVSIFKWGRERERERERKAFQDHDTFLSWHDWQWSQSVNDNHRLTRSNSSRSRSNNSRHSSSNSNSNSSSIWIMNLRSNRINPPFRLECLIFNLIDWFIFWRCLIWIEIVAGSCCRRPALGGAAAAAWLHRPFNWPRLRAIYIEEIMGVGGWVGGTGGRAAVVSISPWLCRNGRWRWCAASIRGCGSMASLALPSIGGSLHFYWYSFYKPMEAGAGSWIILIIIIIIHIYRI